MSSLFHHLTKDKVHGRGTHGDKIMGDVLDMMDEECKDDDRRIMMRFSYTNITPGGLRLLFNSGALTC